MHNEIYADTILRSVAIAVARNQVGVMRPLQEVLTSEGITQDEYKKMHANPMYQKYLATYTKKLREEGFSFEAKSGALGEDLLPTVYYMAKDPDVPAATRLAAIDKLVTWGNLAPKKDLAAIAAGAGTGFSISFNFPDMSQPFTATVKPAVSDDVGEDIEGELEDDDTLLIEDNPTASSDLDDLFFSDSAEFDFYNQEPVVQEPVQPNDPKEPALKVHAVKDDDSIRRKLANIFDDDDEYAGEDFLE